MILMCALLLLGGLGVPTRVHADDWTRPVTKLPTCTEEGYTWQQNVITKEIRKYNFLPAYGHDWDYDNPETIQERTCTRWGIYSYPCKNGRLLHIRPHSKTVYKEFYGHDWKPWVIDPAPTCENDGQQIRQCRRDPDHGQMEVLPALGHNWRPWSTVTPATATKPGLERRVCIRDASHVEERVIPAEGDVWHPWETDFDPTCTTDGQETRKQKADPSIIQTRPIFALGHDWKCKVTRASTCTAKGEQSCVCRRDSTHVAISELPLAAHKPRWEVTKAPTYTEAGERKLICQVCRTVLSVEAVPMLTRTYYINRTMCPIGLSFRDVAPGSTKEWINFIPLDLSQEGEQSYPLIAANAYVIGSMKVNVSGGQLTVSYELIKGATAGSEYLTFYPDLAAALAQEPAKLGGKNYPIGQPISIADDLAGDTSVLLLLCNRVSYHDELKGLTRFYPRNPEHAKLLEAMKAMLPQQ